MSTQNVAPKNWVPSFLRDIMLACPSLLRDKIYQYLSLVPRRSNALKTHFQLSHLAGNAQGTWTSRSLRRFALANTSSLACGFGMFWQEWILPAKPDVRNDCGSAGKCQRNASHWARFTSETQLCRVCRHLQVPVARHILGQYQDSA